MPKAKTVLKLNGKPFRVNGEGVIRRFLDKSPHDELFTSAELQSRTGSVHVKDRASKLPPYTFKVGVIRYWGNPKAIAALKAQVANEG